jgi:hypothetical protein
MTIKINIISNNNGYGLTQDYFFLNKMLSKTFPKKKLEIHFINFYDHKSDPSDINIFLETVSHIHTFNSKYNILIPNQEFFYKTCIPYISEFDHILVKTQYANTIFSSFKCQNIDFLGWKSRDMYNPNIKKNYQKCLHICGRSKYKQTQLIIDNWDESFPELVVVYNRKKIIIDCPIQDNISYIVERIKEDKLKLLMNQCGIHICTSETEGYGHYIHEGKSTGAIIVTTDANPMKSHINTDFGILIKANKKPLKKALGSKYVLDIDNLHSQLKNLFQIPNKKMKQMSKESRSSYLRAGNFFSNSFQTIFESIFNKVEQLIQPSIIQHPVKNLPNISIVTITYNRRRFFKLAILNFLQTVYPRDKIEWVIVDDGVEEIKDLLPDDDRINYYKYKNKMNFGEKRNLAVGLAKNPYIIFMDDDDYYPLESFSKRINAMLSFNKPCCVCTTIGCYHISKYSSIMNVPPYQLPFGERVSEASMAFTKEFWEQQKFNDNSKGGEAQEFLKNRMKDCVELSPDGIIVSLLHNKNTSYKQLMMEKPNGCHFGFSDKLFTFISGLESSNETEEVLSKSI